MPTSISLIFNQLLVLTLCQRQFRWWLANFKFCHCYNDIDFGCCLHLRVCFQIASLEKMTSPHVDLGAQSGNETQYVFSEGDVHPSDADNVGLAAEGEFIIP